MQKQLTKQLLQQATIIHEELLQAASCEFKSVHPLELKCRCIICYVLAQLARYMCV